MQTIGPPSLPRHVQKRLRILIDEDFFSSLQLVYNIYIVASLFLFDNRFQVMVLIINIIKFHQFRNLHIRLVTPYTFKFGELLPKKRYFVEQIPDMMFCQSLKL